jgi:hypothetical protein
MPLVYWFSDGVGKDVNTGGPQNDIAIPTVLVRWIRTKGSPSLIVNGGDVYPSGDTSAFTEFFKQMDKNVTLMCETPGNHDWKDAPDLPEGRFPHGYEMFWADPEHPSKQRVDFSKKGGARYEHFIDLGGWRLIFLDTGDYKDNPWPAGDAARVTWLNDTITPGRANIVFAHHSRLSRGNHGDNDKLDPLWQTLFDAAGAPRVAFTLSGHDHNVSVYGPRSRDNPTGPAVSPDKGIYVFVNGAGGDGHYSQGFFASGTKPDVFKDDDNFCVTRINLIDAKSADVDVLSFGSHAKTDPVAIPQSLVRVRLP